MERTPLQYRNAQNTALHIAALRKTGPYAVHSSGMISIPMSEAQYAAAATRLHANGIDLTGTMGKLTKDGITASYVYAAGILTVEILDRPMLLPLSLIEAKLQSYLEQSVAYDASKAL